MFPSIAKLAGPPQPVLLCIADTNTGKEVGPAEGRNDGAKEGFKDTDGKKLGIIEGLALGKLDGKIEGYSVGIMLGYIDGLKVGV